MQENNNSSQFTNNTPISSFENETAPKVEFIVSEEKEESGLVFEDAAEVNAQVPALPKLTFNDASHEEKENKEISVPEKFEVNSKYDTESKTEERPRVFTAYVPRFTEVSENFRMADIPHQNRTGIKQTEPIAEESESPQVDNQLDPTAEIYGEKNNAAVSVNIGKSKSDEEESPSRVFKFVENELPKAAQIETDVDDAAEEEHSEQIEEPEAEEPEAEESEEYTIPDPIDETEAVVDYVPSTALIAGRVLEDAPAGIGDTFNGVRKGAEYTAYSQRDAYKDAFIDKKMSICVRFFAALALLLLLAVSETMFALGVDIPAIMNLSDVPGAMALLDMQFIICLYLLAIPETVRAVKQLALKKITPDLFLSAQLVAVFVYTVFAVVHSPRKYMLFGLIFAVSVLGAIFASYLKTKADFKGFLLVSQNGDKSVIDNKYTRTLERENSALDGVVKEHKSKTVRMFKTTFVSDFFRRSEENVENSFNTWVIMAITFGFALVLSVIAFFIPGGAVSAATAFALTVMMGCPVVSVVAHKVAFYHAETTANNDGCAIIGESALVDYSGVDVVTFEDTEVFGEEDVALQRIMLYGNSENLSKALCQMSALFMNVGGPLNILFSNSLDRKCSPAQFVSVENGGVSGEIEGHSVLAGTMEYMLRHGVRIPEGENYASDSNHDSTKVMYAAEDGAIYAKFYIRYSFSEEFSMLLPILEDYGITPLVYTRDPNVTRELIATLTAGNDKMRVLKKNDTSEKENVVYRKVSCGMITMGEKNEAVNSIILSKKYSELMSRFAKLELLAMGAGGIFATVLSIGGFVSLPSLVPAIWHTALSAAMYIFSKITFRQNKGDQ